jgi:hypothetical protein
MGVLSPVPRMGLASGEVRRAGTSRVATSHESRGTESRRLADARGRPRTKAAAITETLRPKKRRYCRRGDKATRR